MSEVTLYLILVVERILLSLPEGVHPRAIGAIHKPWFHVANGAPRRYHYLHLLE